MGHLSTGRVFRCAWLAYLSSVSLVCWKNQSDARMTALRASGSYLALGPAWLWQRSGPMLYDRGGRGRYIDPVPRHFYCPRFWPSSGLKYWVTDRLVNARLVDTRLLSTRPGLEYVFKATVIFTSSKSPPKSFPEVVDRRRHRSADQAWVRRSSWRWPYWRLLKFRRHHSSVVRHIQRHLELQSRSRAQGVRGAGRRTRIYHRSAQGIK